MSMCKSWSVFLLAMSMLFAGGGCTDDVEFKGKTPRSDPSEAWKRVVQKATSEDGIDFDRIERNRNRLEAYLKWSGTHGQHTDSWRESREDKRLAHLLNVHNAAVIHNVLRHRPIDSPDDVQFGLYRWPGAGFYRGTRYKVDKEYSTLKHIAVHDTVHRYQEALLNFAIHDGTRDSAPLRWWPGKKLQTVLKKAARAFLASDRGLIKTESGYAANPMFFDSGGRDFTFWTGANTVCEWMVKYTKGDTKQWLDTHAEDCPLERRPADRRLDAAQD